jgi:hypothetical protein
MAAIEVPEPSLGTLYCHAIDRGASWVVEQGSFNLRKPHE